MFSVRVWADVWSEPASHLDITGGTLDANGKDDLLIWEMGHKLIVRTNERSRGNAMKIYSGFTHQGLSAVHLSLCS